MTKFDEHSGSGWSLPTSLSQSEGLTAAIEFNDAHAGAFTAVRVNSLWKLSLPSKPTTSGCHRCRQCQPQTGAVAAVEVDQYAASQGGPFADPLPRSTPASSITR
ncbi:uncharacterized protein K452DRAFT_312755 [Aplosporella prunicola CBS 121167]|uniref:Uncharacterized protein n=1 Tax=Aplosporella prunicola CBS 121167 TaxID=1176127 RepID=A0A6A6B113_9PEZI|nr:uncharacterized protein K452DRAFT_312755 [Aplosporella prunicola CBS 121167]KAF2136945.1 hypothetical protein K452DRAFT_312755 [Aplosporella prunicola CBS 121167]